MIVPSIDIQNKSTVQLIGGQELAVDAGDPGIIAQRFSRVGEIAVIDLDAARGQCSLNESAILDLVRTNPCRVGGGIRSVKRAREWLNAGVSKVILGTAARPEILKALPKERVIAALDAVHDEVVVQGWTQGTGVKLLDAIAPLRDLVGGFLITRVEREGRMGGIDLEDAKRLRDACGPAKLTFAGGVATAREVAQLDAEGIDTQVGMALYTGAFSLADTLGAMLVSDRKDGLWPTVVCDERGNALGLAYSSQRSLQASLETGEAHYESRRRGLWKKGASSGATQQCLRVDLDCDRDALRFVVRQSGPGFCHLDRRSCFEGENFDLSNLERIIASRVASAPEGSYTRRLLQDRQLLASKIMEEADELVRAQDSAQVRREMADLIYFALVRGRQFDVDLREVEEELERRSKRVDRRAGDAKPGYEVRS